MKLKGGFHKNFIAIFSNIGNEDQNAFYLLMVTHKNGKGGFNEPITIGECKKILRRKNKDYYYQEV